MFVVFGGLFFEVIRLLDLIELFVFKWKKILVDFLELLDVIFSKFFNVFCDYVDGKFIEIDKWNGLEFKEIFYGFLNEDSSFDSFVVVVYVGVSIKEFKDMIFVCECYMDGVSEMNI